MTDTTAEAERDELRTEIAAAETRLADMTRSREEWQWRANDAERKVRIQRDRATNAEAELDALRDTEATVQRVTDLYERWVKAGLTPIGTSTARWWDARLIELHTALNPTKEH